MEADITLTWAVWLAAAAAILAAGITQGALGFGFPTISTPVLVLVTDVKTGGQGCSISQASTSMMSAAIKGKSVDEVRTLIRAFKALMSIHESKLEGSPEDGDPEDGEHETDLSDELEGVRLGDLEALQGVVKFPVRIKCATLGWNVLQQGLEETETSSP